MITDHIWVKCLKHIFTFTMLNGLNKIIYIQIWGHTNNFNVSNKFIVFVFLFHSLKDLDRGQCRHHPSTQIKIKYAWFNRWMEHEKQKHCFTTMQDRDYIDSACLDFNWEWKYNEKFFLTENNAQIYRSA